ncbi:mucin-binding protein [Limosilactobacillus fermentum]|uniref:mucin-binding protein n=1 Tax=Limosilactobacillus fermentum TaxID=1613 RepID=UPI00209AD5CA|nr:LPXTG cell wall anchor domain-containing protein [Limosilactobacillus fermentum]
MTLPTGFVVDSIQTTASTTTTVGDTLKSYDGVNDTEEAPTLASDEYSQSGTTLTINNDMSGAVYGYIILGHYTQDLTAEQNTMSVAVDYVPVLHFATTASGGTNFYNADGQGLTYVQEAGTNTVDTVTGLVMAYGDWSVTGDRTSFTSITTPVVTGYVADKASSTVDNATPSEGTAESDTVTYSPVGTVTITKPGGTATTAAYTNDQSDATKVTSFSVPAVAGYSAQVTGATLQSDGTYLPDSPTQASTVTYTADPQSFTVTYVDETTNTTLTDHGLTLTGVTAGSYADQLASDKWDYAAAGYKLDTAKNATDPLSELSGTFGAQNAGVTVYLTHQTSTTTQTQTITRTINYLDPTTKELTSLTQTAELTWTVEEDLVTGAKTYSQWTTATWPSFTVPSVAGYTASPTVVPALVVKDGDGDVTVTIAYTKLVPNSSAASSSPASASSASATPNSASAGSSAASAATNSASAVSAAPAAVTNTAPTSAAKATSAVSEQKLPQTGDDEQAALSLTGVSLLSLLTLLGVGRKKKRHSKN